MRITIFVFALLTVCWTANGKAYAENGAGKPFPNPALSAFNMLLTQLDENRDGKLSHEEFLKMYKDPRIAEEKFSFWDRDKNGEITAEEYTEAVAGIRSKSR